MELEQGVQLDETAGYELFEEVRVGQPGGLGQEEGHPRPGIHLPGCLQRLPHKARGPFYLERGIQCVE